MAVDRANRGPVAHATQGLASAALAVYNAIRRLLLWLAALSLFSSNDRKATSRPETINHNDGQKGRSDQHLTGQEGSARELPAAERAAKPPRLDEIPASDLLLASEDSRAVQKPIANHEITSDGDAHLTDPGVMETRRTIALGTTGAASPLGNITNNASAVVRLAEQRATQSAPPAPPPPPAAAPGSRLPPGCLDIAEALEGPNLPQALRRLALDDKNFPSLGPVSVPAGSENDPQKETNQKFMNLALDMASPKFTRLHP